MSHNASHGLPCVDASEVGMSAERLARIENREAILGVFELGSLPPMEDVKEGGQSDAVKEEDPYDNF